jgi:hypothetical protein
VVLRNRHLVPHLPNRVAAALRHRFKLKAEFGDRTLAASTAVLGRHVARQGIAEGSGIAEAAP